MYKSGMFAMVVLTLLLSASAQEPVKVENSSSGQEVSNAKSSPAAPEHYYRLDFRVLELSAESKVTNSRSYTATVVTGMKGARTSSIRTADRIPVNVGGDNFTYMDSGVNVDIEGGEEVGQSVHFFLRAEVKSLSSLPPASAERPVTRQTSWNSYVSVPIGKPTIVFASDNAADHGKSELEILATPIK